MSDKDKKPYLEGFSQALLLSNKGQAQSGNAPPQTKRFSLLTRVYIAVIIAIMLAFMSGGELRARLCASAQQCWPQPVLMRVQ